MTEPPCKLALGPLLHLGTSSLAGLEWARGKVNRYKHHLITSTWSSSLTSLQLLLLLVAINSTIPYSGKMPEFVTGGLLVLHVFWVW